MRIEEKPKNPTLNWTITDLYFFDERVVRYAGNVKPSERGALEITICSSAISRPMLSTSSEWGAASPGSIQAP